VGGGGGGGERRRKGTMQALARSSRGIAAAVRSLAVEAAHGGQLSVMEREIRSSGMERLIRARTHHHARRSCKKLREILVKHIRSVLPLSDSIRH
jgi:small subunit ribosomal protein S21